MAKVYVEKTEGQHVSSTSDWRIIVGTGIGAGAALWGLAWVLGAYIIEPLLCQNLDLRACEQPTDIAGNIALIISGITALGVLTRFGVRRSLLMVVAVTATLWGLVTIVQPFQWYESLVWVVGASLLAYGVFYWFSRVKNIAAALLVSALIVAGVRIVLSL